MTAEFKKWWTAEGKELFSLLVNDVSYSDAYLVWKEAVQAAQKDLEPWLKHRQGCRKLMAPLPDVILLEDQVNEDESCNCGLDEKRLG